MARLDELVAHCDELLEPGRFRDFCPNGLQVPGGEEVVTIVTGVSAGAELFERAIAEVLESGLRTADIMSDGMTRIGTGAMGDAVLARFQALSA